MLERKKLYRFVQEYQLSDSNCTRQFKVGDCFVIAGYYQQKLVSAYGETYISDTSTLEPYCESVLEQLAVDSIVKIAKFSDIGGTRWGSDDLMLHTLNKIGIVQSVGMTVGNNEPWYKVKVGEDAYYYDKASLEQIELEENQVVCHDCGKIIDIEDSLTTYDDNYICNDCYGDDYGTCEDCDQIHPNSEMNYLSGRNVCDTCKDENYAMCPHCGEWFRTDNGYWDNDISDDTYCSEDCFSEATGGRYFHDYSYKPYPDFHKCAGETVVSGYYGVELELELDGADRADTAKDITVTGKEFVYCKRDGSLDDGIEIVSHPATYKYHMTDIWRKIIDTAVEDGMRSETSCGLHVHASRTLFGEHPLAQELTIAKVLYCFERLWDNIVIFSRRENISYIEDWARKSDTGIVGTDDNSTVRDKLRNNAPKGRYSAVNLCNSQTVEFRIFASTTDVEDLKGSIGFVHTLIMYCSTHTIKQCQMLTWDNLTKYAFKRSPEFYKLSKKLIKVGK